jgi:hypothetical protein
VIVARRMLLHLLHGWQSQVSGDRIDVPRQLPPRLQRHSLRLRPVTPQREEPIAMIVCNGIL